MRLFQFANAALWRKTLAIKIMFGMSHWLIDSSFPHFDLCTKWQQPLWSLCWSQPSLWMLFDRHFSRSFSSLKAKRILADRCASRHQYFIVMSNTCRVMADMKLWDYSNFANTASLSLCRKIISHKTVLFGNFCITYKEAVWCSPTSKLCTCSIWCT